ncbi:carbohydrate ABC transporter permease [Salinispira pacifica]|uniref:Putative chitobiose ABC transport system, permease protein 2 n=1 Tax=Salinispira pacifica TaxID=1307761 RepID=V5WJ62_9SPIO|nr:carbohydrate ABC transporter permease [Salinispira pacifica]AHC15872.1 putative chitobiose ABC transport system, permease protein 2 [Salinispira pacifica]
MIYRQSRVEKIILYAFLVFMAILSIVPFYMMIINSTHTNVEISQRVWFTPGSALLENYQIIQDKVNIWQGFIASLIITVPSVVLAAIFSTMTAYGFAKFQFRGKEVLFWIILGTMMVPQQLGLIGYYDLLSKIGMIDSYLPLIIPTAAHAAMVFFIRAYIESSISDSLIEAAIIDGGGEWYIFRRIIFPLAMPSIATMSIFTFIQKWNDLLTPLVLLNSAKKFPMPVVVSNIRGLYESNFGAIYLGVTISIIPIIIVVIIFSRSIIKGLTVGAIKG